MAAETSPAQDTAGPPLISQTVAGIFAGFGLVAALGMGWILARSSSGTPPFPMPFQSVAPLPANGQAQTLRVVASDLKFDTKELRVGNPGEVRVELENKGLIDHDFTIEGQRFTVVGRPGKTADKTVKLDKAGRYTFYCSLPGHREAGMAGTLIVGNGTAGATNTGAKTQAAAAGVSPTAAGGSVSHATAAATEKKGNQEMVPVMDGATKVFTLTARAVQWEVLPGVTEEAWVYNDQLPGPMIRVQEGDRLRVVLKNELPEATVIHFHGPRLPNAMDGVPDVTQPVVPVGGSFTYEFTASPAGTFVYHTHHNTATQEPKGLYGVLIIDPAPGSAQAQRDAQYARDYTQVISEFGGYFTINGHSFPATDAMEAKAGEKIRIRLVNLGQSIHPMHLHGFHFRVVGTDGYPVEGPPLVKDTLNIAPGERYDLEVLVDNPGAWIFHCHILSHVTNQGVEPGGMISVLKVTA